MTITNKQVHTFITCVFLGYLGVPYLPKSLGMAFWILVVLACAYYAIYYSAKIERLCAKDKNARAVVWLFKFLMIISVVYFIFSIIGVFSLWDIPGLQFDRTFSFRHYLSVAALFVPAGLGYAIYRTDYIARVKNLWLWTLFAYLLFIRFYTSVGVIESVFAYSFIITLLAYRLNKHWLVFFVLLANHDQAAFVLGSLFVIVMVYMRHISFMWLRTNTITKILALLCCMAFVLFLYYDEFLLALYLDLNTQWRWQVWSDEMESLSQTYFTGVGFGMAYVTKHFLSVVNNPNMYYSADGTPYDELFKVASHNSFITMFYRMGILGGCFFFFMYLKFIQWSINAYKRCNTHMRIYVFSALAVFFYYTFVILFNPGLEMMQFSMNFCLSSAVLFAALLKESKDNARRLQIKTLRNALQKQYEI